MPMNGKGIDRLRFNMDQPVNLTKASTVCNFFYVFLSAAKASLLPFLTLFFRILGLNAFDTGIIMAAKTLTGFIWAPLWARCAVAYNKRRIVLIFSLIMMTVMYLAFIGVYYKVGVPHSCHPSHMVGNATVATASGQGNYSGPANNTGGPTPGTSEGEAEGEGGSTETVTTSHPGGELHTEGDAGTSADTTTSINKTAQNNSNNNDNAPSQGTGSAAEPPHGTAHTPSSTDGTTPSPGVNNTLAKETDKQSGKQSEQQGADDESGENFDGEKVMETLDRLKGMLQPFGVSLDDLNALSAEDIQALMHRFVPDMKLSKENIQQLKDIYTKSKTKAPGEIGTGRHGRNLNFVFLNKLKETVGSMAATLEEQKLLLFLVVLLIVVFGEFFSSPVEKIADDAWFDFLERIDDMEKYGRQRYWGSFAYAIIPIIVGIAVDFTPCQLFRKLHHFLIHFYVFGIFMVIAIAIAIYFPMPPPVKQKYHSKVGKGLRLICCDCRGFLFVVTLLIAGMLYASFNNFLFWHLLDMGSQEVTMGLCVSIAAFAETPMLVFSGKLVRKLGNGWVVALSLLVLALRLLYYGFVWTPWAVLPMEVTNAFTHTALWYAILSYDEFNQGSAMDRSVRSILSSFYFGLGFSAGSLLSGLVFHICGAHILFWGASVISAAWCIIYSLFQLCLPKKEKVRYIKLLRKEEDDTSEGEDDWLEMALKEQ